MSREIRNVMLYLEEDDSRLLEAIHHESGESRVGVIRWALRYYAMYGPYTRSEADRMNALKGIRIGSVGLSFEEAV